MGMPQWWNERRLGLFVHANVATVPAWAPIGQYAEWYRSHLGEDVDDVVLHPRPMVEVLAHHRDRWGHIDRYDDFVSLLTFDRFDPEDWTGLARDAGAGYSIFVSKHHDGWAWWDAPNTKQRLTEHGPGRNVLAEYAAACERNDITFGTYYSLLDWGDERYPGADYVTDVLHTHVCDLVERYGSSVLWGDGHWGHDAGAWQTAALLDRVRAIDPDVVINDRWWASRSDVLDGGPEIVRTFEYDAPDDIVAGPWELCRGIGHSFGHNRAERAADHLTGLEIVDLYTEVIAKGGNLLLDVGPAADGTIPDLQAAPLREAGTWIRRFDHLLSSSTPWVEWGDRNVRYVRADPSGADRSRADGTGDVVDAIDVSGRGHFAQLDPARYRVRSVDFLAGPLADDSATVGFVQHDDGVRLLGPPRHPSERFGDDAIGVGVYRIVIAPANRPSELFEPASSPPAATPLSPLLDGTRPGDIVQIGSGAFVGPGTVPAGVVLRGLGASRTTVHAAQEGGIATPGPAITVERSGRVEHLGVTGPPGVSTRSDWVAPVLVTLAGESATMLGCTVDGHVHVTADAVTVRALTGRGIVAIGTDRLSLSRCSFTGNRWDTGVQLIGGGGHLIESSDFTDHLCAIKATKTTGTEIRGNTICSRWWGVHLDRTEDAHVHANHVRSTMRAVDIEGGTQATIDGNAVIDGDSGCIVEWGASRCDVGGNHWERCRIGLLSWDATDLNHHDNVTIDLHEPDGAHVTGP